MSGTPGKAAAVIGVVILALGLGACSSPPPDKHIELTFASWVFISDEQKAFMADVESSSGGSITFRPLDNWTEPDGVEKLGDEFSMAKAMAAGDIDMGWTSTRAFPALGIDGFRAIEAPFLIQNPESVADIVTGPIGEDALAAFTGSGLTGLSIYGGSLRFPLTNGRPLLEPADWAGKQILYYAPTVDSVQARTVEAFGGKPVATGLHIVDDLNAGLYAGGTDSLGDIAAGGATPSGPYPSSNVVMWPTVLFYVINTDKYASLSKSQRTVITEAAERAAQKQNAVVHSQDLAAPICATTRFGTATPEQLASLRAAVQPVYDWLQQDPAEAALLSSLEKIAAAHPEADVVTVPDGCAWSPTP